MEAKHILETSEWDSHVVPLEHFSSRPDADAKGCHHGLFFFFFFCFNLFSFLLTYLSFQSFSSSPSSVAFSYKWILINDLLCLACLALAMFSERSNVKDLATCSTVNQLELEWRGSPGWMMMKALKKLFIFTWNKLFNFILVTAGNFKSHCPVHYHAWEIHHKCLSELVMFNYCFEGFVIIGSFAWMLWIYLAANVLGSDSECSDVPSGCFMIAGVPVVQHPALSWPEEDHPLDSLDPRQYLRQRRPLRAALPLHVQSSHPRPQPAGSGQAADRDALLLQWWIYRLLNRRWVQRGEDRWSLSSYLGPWMFLCYLTPAGFQQVDYWPPRLKPCLWPVFFLFFFSPLTFSNFYCLSLHTFVP